MSVQASTWAWAQLTTSSGQRLVLLALADTADDTGECWPGVRRICEKTQLSERQVRSHLDALEAAELLDRSRRRRPDGTLGTYTYRLAMATGSAQPQAAHRRPSGSPPPLDQRQPTAAQNRQHITVSEPSENTPSAELELRRDRFAELWLAYPRKVGKPQAERAYRQVAAEHDAIMAGLERWVTYWAEHSEPRYVPHPTTWLHRRGWEDETPTPGPRRRAGTVQATVDTAQQVLEQLRQRAAVAQQLAAATHEALELEAGGQ